MSGILEKSRGLILCEFRKTNGAPSIHQRRKLLDSLLESNTKGSRVRSYFALGVNLGVLEEGHFDSLLEFISAVHVVLQYFDSVDQKRIQAAAKASKHQLRKKMSFDAGHPVTQLQSHTPSESSGSTVSSVSTVSSGGSELNHSHSHNLRTLSVKGRKLFGNSKPKQEQKKTSDHKQPSRFSSLLSFTHNDEMEESLTALSPIHSRSTAELKSSSSQSGKLSLSMSARKFFSGSSSPTHSDKEPPFQVLNAMSQNALNATHGTGTYTMGVKKQFFSNVRADHSSVNQNQLTEPEVPVTMQKFPDSRNVVENLFLVNEQDLPFVPDSVESIITLLDVMSDIYRTIRDTMDSPHEFTQSELNRIDIKMSIMENLTLQTVLTDGLVDMDSEYVERKPTSSAVVNRSLIEKDILRTCHNEPRMSRHKSVGFLEPPLSMYGSVDPTSTPPPPPQLSSQLIHAT